MLDIRKKVERSKLILELSGEMDLSNHMAFIHVTEITNKSDYDSSIIDMSNLKFIDSTGIRTLIDVSQKLIDNTNGNLKIINISEDIKEVFELLDIESVLGKEVFQ